MIAVPEDLQLSADRLSAEVTEPFPASHKIYVAGSRADLRVPHAVLEARAPEHNSLVNQRPVAHRRRLADHNAHPVIDEYAVADRCAGVDLDSREEARELGQQSCGKAEHVRWVRQVAGVIRP